MRTLKAIGLLFTILFTTTLLVNHFIPNKWDHIKYPLEYKQEILSASKRYNLDPYLICAIIYVESKFNPSSESNKGAIGLMQVMPETGQWVANKRNKEFAIYELSDPEKNIEIGCWYFSYLLTKYKNEQLALAAYNSGLKNVDRWMAESNYETIEEMVMNIPYPETRNFIRRVESAKKAYRKIYINEF